MTGATMSRSASLSVFPEIFRVTLRQLLGRRRTLLLLLLAVLPPLLAVVFRAANETDIRAFTRGVFEPVSMTIVLPLAAVLFGTGAFGAEVDDGTILYLLAKPVSRWIVVFAKAFAAAILTIGMTVASVLLAGVVELLPAGAEGVSATEAYVVAMVVGSICYVAVFVALSLFTRRALIIGIGYTLVWEGALSSLLPGIANLSIRQYGIGAGDAFFQLHSGPAPLSPTTAFTLSAVLIVAALAIATWRLMRFELSGGSD
ncbi:MAG: ABC transporter permease subunit [Candidatus Limnocylindrales bacterium]